MNTDPYSYLREPVDFSMARLTVQGRPLPSWAAHFGGVIIPPSFPRYWGEPDEFTLAAYLWGRGTA